MQNQGQGIPDIDESNGEADSFDGIAEAKTTNEDHPDADEDGTVKAAVPFACGESLDAAVEEWNEEFVYDHFAALFKRRLQNRVRRDLKNGVPVDRVEEEYSIENYDPTDTGRSSGDDVTQLMRKLGKLDDEEKEEVREALDL